MNLPLECLDFFAKLIEADIGIVYSRANYYQLDSRLEDMAKQLGLDGPLALWHKAREVGLDPAVKGLLLDLATNNETRFFRDANIFSAIRRILLESRASSGAAPYRIWSTACSTGQEIYSLAMIVDELREKRPIEVTILGTDISDRVLERARSGRFSQLEIQRGLNASQVIRHFEQASNASDPLLNWAIKSHLRRGLSFEKRNLLDEWPAEQEFDMVLCRNVLIYQTIENKKRIITKLRARLAQGGYLILGGSESLIGLSESFDCVTIENAVVYRLADSSLVEKVG